MFNKTKKTDKNQSASHPDQTQPAKKPASTAKRIYRVVSALVFLVVFFVLIITCVSMIVQRNNGQSASIMGYYFFDVVTDSMKPTIVPGDMILSKKVDPQTLKKGDIITFIAPSGVFEGYNITHRIHEVHFAEDGSIKYFKTKGDNPNTDVDSWNLDPDNVISVYKSNLKLLAGLKEFLTHWYGYFVLIVLPLLIVGVLIIVGFYRDRVKLAVEENSDTKTDLDMLSDEDKQKLIEQFASNAGQESENGGEVTEMVDDSAVTIDTDTMDADDEPENADDELQKVDIDAENGDVDTENGGENR